MRAISQRLARPVGIRAPVDVARLAGPIQAQEPRAAKLAFRARSRRLVAADVNHARCEERSLLRAWMMRRTVHLIAADDAGWLLPLFAEQLARQARKRMADNGVARDDQDRALRLLLGAVESNGPLTRPQLSERLAAAGFGTAQEIKVHLWVLATVEGGLCLGPDRGGQSCLVRVGDWLGAPEDRPREDSLAELARRYLRGYGPASDRDFARWAGLPLRDCHAGLERIAGEISASKVDGQTLLRLKRGAHRTDGPPVVRLLGAYDNYNLGYETRDYAVKLANVEQIVPGGGIVRPTITVDGRFVGTWTSKRSGRRLAISIEPFQRLDQHVIEEIETEVEDIGRFEGLSATLA